MLLHYLGKLKNRNFALFMHVKHVSNVTFYHLSNSYLSNVIKISAKINSMQNINILHFVCQLSLTSLNLLTDWRNASLRYGPISDRTLSTLQLTQFDRWRKCLQACVCANDGHFEHFFVNKLLQTICIFSCVFGSSGFCPSCHIFTVLMLDGR